MKTQIFIIECLIDLIIIFSRKKLHMYEFNYCKLQNFAARLINYHVKLYSIYIS